MKKTKILLTLVCAILLVAASVMGTLAYLTATTTQVVNTFTVGNVSFADVALDEAKVNEYGEKLNGNGDVYEGNEGEQLHPRVTGNEYKLIPGHTYTKDPTVHMSTTSELAYLFVTVDNGIKDIEAGTTIAKQMTNGGWKEVKDNSGEVVAYIWYDVYGDGTIQDARNMVAMGQDIKVFSQFSIKSDADVSKYGDATITIQAYAIQADGFDETTSDYDLWLLASANASANTNG